MDSWAVAWRNPRGEDQRREFATYLEAWTFNEEQLKGCGEVTLLTDRLVDRARPHKNEAAAAREQEGGGRRYPRRK